jgi:predicted secreted protein
MTPRTKVLLAVGGGAAALVGVVALLSRSQSAPSAPAAPKTCPINPNIAATPPMAYSAGFAQTGTALTINVGDTLRVHLLRPGAGAGTQWTLTMDDDSELHLDKQTTGPELGSPFGTSDIWEFTAVAPGAVNLTGSVGGSWHLTVKVVCG